MKKNLILTIAGMLAIQISMAQTQKGAQTLGGYLSYSRSTVDDSAFDYYSNQMGRQKSTNSNFQIGPSYGYFVANELEIKGSLQYSRATNKIAYDNVFTNGGSDQTSNTFGGQLSLLKYFMYGKLGLRTGPYLGYSHGVSKLTQEGSAVTTTTNSNSYNGGLRAELVYYPSKSLGFAATLANLGYSKTKSRNPSDWRQNGSNEYFNTTFISNGLGLSVFYVFGSK